MYQDCDEDIMSTLDDMLYCTYRESTPGGRFNPIVGPFAYEIPVPQSGQYRLTLHFTETRVFSANGGSQIEIVAQSNVVKSAFDIVAEAGGRLRPVQITTTQPVYQVGNQVFTVEFNLVPGASLPRVSALELEYIEGATLTPSLSPTSLAPTVSPETIPIRIRAGFSSTEPSDRYYDEEGNLWHQDQFYEGGTRNIFGCRDTVAELFCSAHMGNTFSYRIPVPTPGDYTVTLYFMETSVRVPGAEVPVFDVVGESGPIVTGFDPLAEAGGAFVVTTLSATETITDGYYDLSFASTQRQAYVNAIMVDFA